MLRPTRPHAVSYSLPEETLASRLRATVAGCGGELAVIEGERRLTYAELATAADQVAAGLRARGVRTGDTVLVQLPNWWETVVVCWGTLLAGAVLVPVVPIYRERELGHIVGQTQPAAAFVPEEYRSYRHADALRSVLAAAGPATGGRPGGPVVVAVRGSGDTPGVEALADWLAGPPRPGPLAGADGEPGAAPADIAVVLYTSGTTSAPKGVLHSHQTLLAETRAMAGAARLGPADRVFMASPLSHITGLSYGVLLPADLGCAVVLQSRWDADAAVDLIEEHRATFTVSATPFLRGLTDVYARRGRRSSLRVFVCGGADIPPALIRQAGEVLGTRVVRTYGSTELPTSSMADPYGDLAGAADNEGPPMGDNELVVDPGPLLADSGAAGGPPAAAPARDAGWREGELLVRGPELFLGYLDPRLNDEAFTPDGFFRTGDVARIGPDGTLAISGRIKDIINRGGEKFSAAEVEAVLLTHPAVQDVAVVASPDPVLVERACAFVVPAAGSAPPDLAALRDHLTAAGLAIQKAPELLVIVNDLPRTPSGKVQKFLLRQRAAVVAPPPPAAADRPAALGR
ncbi:MAG: AMP-binding protein [Frankia sp.]|nr:AMP-binding protein [Frankia sp.]